MSEEARIEEIRQRVADVADYSISEDELVERYPEDAVYLLKRVEELDAENERLREERDNYKHQAWEMGEHL